MNVLELKQLEKNFGENRVLKGINLSANKGDVISIIGSSGSGKSTMLRCINFLETPDNGSINVCGETIDCSKVDLSNPDKKLQNQIINVRKKLGMVFQSFNLWSHMNILDNITEAPVHVLGKDKEEVEQEAMKLLEQVGIKDKAYDYPVHLSGGQQQRAAIARALAISPEILLFDEPTSSLDPELVDEVLSVMRKLAEEGKTMLVVTHEMEFARKVSNKVIFLHDGLIEEEGHPDTVFTNPQSERCRNFLFNRRD
ncbi:amino acid ABC transporter, ATP-binding protein, PAAT family [alpha proteobacterium HIMB59]|nr:amino acid ABC transporter, ATP-binding protein, PAAT family [alpha proteobacterium HIMB59]